MPEEMDESKLGLKEMAEFLNREIDGCQAEVAVREKGDSPLFVHPAHIKAVAQLLRNSPQYAMTTLQVITGCDYPDRIELSYILASFIHNTEVIVKVKLSKPSADHVPEIESLCEVWKAANFQERECYDMVGVRFLNHPDHRRILCPDDWQGYPLRKDYQVQEEYNGMVVNPPEKTNREDHHFYKQVQESVADPKKVAFSWKN